MFTKRTDLITKTEARQDQTQANRRLWSDFWRNFYIAMKAARKFPRAPRTFRTKDALKFLKTKEVQEHTS